MTAQASYDYPAARAVNSDLSAESSVSAVSWPAIIAGAFVAASASLILLSLGSGLGLASISPWQGVGISATTFSVMTVIWLVVIQWFASGLGGYLTGRLRSKWVGTHTHEVFYRDTAHGFLAWAVATIGLAFLLASITSGLAGSGIRAAATVGAGAAQRAASTQVSRAYDVDSLFRSSKPEAGFSNTSMADARSETTRILAMGIANGDVPAADRAYLTQLIAARTGILQTEAQKRVDDVVAQEMAAEAKARQLADTARKSASLFSIFTVLSMLTGAFVACVAAALGGRERDEHP
jgi:hypothetical protein